VSEPRRFPQLTLELFSDTGCDFESYFPGPNEQAVCALMRWAAGAGPWYLCVWGRAGVGKTHLLQAAVNAISTGTSAMYVPLLEVMNHGPAILDGLDEVDALCIDDIGLIRDEPQWQSALFDLFNRLQAAAGRLVVSAENSPRGLDLDLRDLSSRLSAGLIYQIHPLGDEDKRAALQAAAARRGLELPEPVASFIMRRANRDMGALNRVFADLDEASLSAGRQLTVPFVRDILGLD
jgi:DnaA family protein